MKILITGGARRIGALLSRRLASAGHQIIIHCNSSLTEAEKLNFELGGSHKIICKDLSSPEQTESIFPELKAEGHLPDILINNASTFFKRGTEDFSSSELQEDYQVNFFSPLLLMRDFRKICKTGKIINLLDRRIDLVEPICGPYLFAKKSLRDATLACAEDWPEININAVAPGPVLLPGFETDRNLSKELDWVVSKTFECVNGDFSGRIFVQSQ